MMETEQPVQAPLESLFVGEDEEMDDPTTHFVVPAMTVEQFETTRSAAIIESEDHDGHDGAADTTATTDASTLTDTPVDHLDRSLETEPLQQQQDDQASPQPAKRMTKKQIEQMQRETERLTRKAVFSHKVATRKSFTLTGFLSKFAAAAPANEEVGSEGLEFLPDERLRGESVVDLSGDATPTDQDEQSLEAIKADKTPLAVDPTTALNAAKAAVSPVTAPSDKTAPPVMPLNFEFSSSEGGGDGDDSDDDLEIVGQPIPGKPDLSIFDKAIDASRSIDGEAVSSQKNRHLALMRSLAQLPASRSPNSPVKKGDVQAGNRNPDLTQAGLTSAQFFSTLQKKARQQALVARAARQDRLREEGFQVDEPSKLDEDDDDVDALLEKFRLEAQRLAGEEADSNSDDDEDEDADDEDDEDDGDDEEDEEANEEEGDEEKEKDQVSSSGSPKMDKTVVIRGRAIMDDDDQEEDEPQDITQTDDPSQTQDLYADFRNIAVPEQSSLSLTQAFAGTAADDGRIKADDLADAFTDSQFGAALGGPVPGAFAAPPSVPTSLEAGVALGNRDDSIDEFGPVSTPTGLSQIFGAVEEWPAGIDSSMDSSFTQRQKMVEPAAEKDVRAWDERAGSSDQTGQKRKKRQDHPAGSTKKARPDGRPLGGEARHLVDDEAELSDDDYYMAGLSDEGDEGDEQANREDAAMIDDSTRFTARDAAALDALFADQTKQADKKILRRLARDLGTGGLRDLYLRRQRRNRSGNGASGGTGLLSDDSDDEASDRRRRQWQLENARIRRALLEADGRYASMAENPVQQSFLRSIEDRDGDQPDGSWLDHDRVHDSCSPGLSASASPAPESANYDDDAVIGGLGEDGEKDGDGADDDDDDDLIRPIVSRSRRRPGLQSRRTGSSLRRVESVAESEANSIAQFFGLDDSQADEFQVEVSASEDETDMSSSATRISTTTTTVKTTKIISTKAAVVSTAGAKPAKAMLFRKLMAKSLVKQTEAHILVERHSGPVAAPPPSAYVSSMNKENKAGLTDGASSVSVKRKVQGRQMLGQMLVNEGFD